MTWQGGKLRPEIGPVSAFAPLKPLATGVDDSAKALRALSKALAGYEGHVRLHMRLVSGDDGQAIEHWDIQGGAKGAAKAERKQPKQADVIVVMRQETWMQIAQGKLAPYEALYSGKLRVGGDMELAKAVTRHLTDPASTYRPPC
jgi:hypothetical protein